MKFSTELTHVSGALTLPQTHTLRRHQATAPVSDRAAQRRGRRSGPDHRPPLTCPVSPTESTASTVADRAVPAHGRPETSSRARWLPAAGPVPAGSSISYGHYDQQTPLHTGREAA